MNCEDCQNKFSEFLDDKLHESQRLALEQHISGCADCRRELQMWRRALEALARLPRRAAPDGFASRIVERIGAEAPPRRRRVLRFVPQAVAAAALVLVTVALTLHFGARERAQETAVPRVAMLHQKAEATEAETKAVELKKTEGRVATGALSVATEKHLRRVQPGARRNAAFGYAGDETERRGKPELGAEAEGAREKGMAGAGAPSKEMARASAGLLEQLKQEERRPAAVFSQIAGATDKKALPLEPPQQILTIASEEPMTTLRRAVRAANENGVSVRLVVAMEDVERPSEMELALKVPVNQYGPLLRAITRLAPPQQQRLSNTAVARGEFFQDRLDEYNAYVRRLPVTKKRGGMAVFAPQDADRLVHRDRARKAAEEEVQPAPMRLAREHPAGGRAGPEPVREVNLLIRLVQLRKQPEREPEKGKEPGK